MSRELFWCMGGNMPGKSYNLDKLIAGYEEALARVRAFLDSAPKCIYCSGIATRWYGEPTFQFRWCDADKPFLTSSIVIHDYPYADLVRWYLAQGTVSDIDLIPPKTSKRKR